MFNIHFPVPRVAERARALLLSGGTLGVICDHKTSVLPQRRTATLFSNWASGEMRGFVPQAAVSPWTATFWLQVYRIKGEIDQEVAMATDISPENEQFIRQEIQAGVFRTKSDALDAGIALLRRRKELLARIDHGRRQLDEGDFRDYDEESLANRFSELRERARRSETERDAS